MRQTVLRRGPELRRRVLLGTVFLAPLFFLPNAYDVFNVPKLWLLMVGVTVVAAIRAVELLQGADRSGLTLIVVPAAAVAAPLLIGTIFSPYRVWALIGDHSRFTGLVPYVVVILLGVLIADTFRGDVRPLAWALSASAATAGAYAVVQVLGIDPLEWSRTEQATVTIGNTNFSGAFFAICLPVAGGLFLVEVERRLLAALAIGFILAGWVFARSELAWAAGAAGLLVMAGVSSSGRIKFARWAGLVAAGVIAFVAVAVVVLAAVDRAPEFVPETIERRAEWWEASARMAADSPIVGRGPNSFAIEHTHHRDIDDVIAVGFDVTDDPHSVPLSFLTGAGIFGLAGFVVFAGWIVLSVARADSNNVLGIAFGAGACAYLVQALLSVDVMTLRFAAWTSVGGMAAAIAPAVSAVKSPVGRKTKKKRQPKQAPQELKALPGVVAVVLLGSLGIAWASGFLSADLRFRRGLSMAAGGAAGAKENLEAAVGFRDSNYTYRAHYGSLLGGNAVQEGLAEGGDLTVARELLQEAKDAFAFIDRLPHANSVVAYARVMRDWAEVDESAEDEALALYEFALKLDPYNFRILDEQAAAAEAFGRADLAAELSARSERLRTSGGS